ncbi:hypothetical protein DWU98_20385 [Dyella monticola]|uniref:Uncharacterized protein n=1 Tax=Dyella monticola TaxID=1927958 RepID=A0A370WRY5_9GAMM|nr:hypothetical protein DWU98_20385 [Dyella monticola]
MSGMPAGGSGWACDFGQRAVAIDRYVGSAIPEADHVQQNIQPRGASPLGENISPYNGDSTTDIQWPRSDVVRTHTGA